MMSLIFVVILFIFLHKSLSFECYVGVQTASAIENYKIVSCLSTVSNNNATNCYVDKFGGTIMKSCRADISIDGHINPYSRFRKQMSSNRWTIGAYSCVGDANSYSCVCNGSLCNKYLPAATSLPQRVTNNTHRCRIGYKIGDVDGYELTTCLDGSRGCQAIVIGATTVVDCLPAQTWQPALAGCWKETNSYPQYWYCSCVVGTRWCNNNDFASLMQEQNDPIASGYFQCTAGMEVGGVNGYQTVTCLYPQYGCQTLMTPLYTMKGCVKCNGKSNYCESNDGWLTKCCCNVPNCNKKHLPQLPSASSSVDPIETNNLFWHVLLVCLSIFCMFVVLYLRHCCRRQSRLLRHLQ